MIYLIGGAARTGKSTLARRFVAAKPMIWTSTDLVQSVLKHTAPELGTRHTADAATQAQ